MECYTGGPQLPCHVRGEPFENRLLTERSTGMRQGQRWAVCCVGVLVGLGILGLGVGSAEDEEKEKAAPNTAPTTPRPCPLYEID